MTTTTRVFATFTGNQDNVLLINPKDVSVIKEVNNNLDKSHYILILSSGESFTLSQNHDLDNIIKLLGITPK